MATTLQTGTAYCWVEVDVQSVLGLGKVLPRLSVTLEAKKLTADTQVKLLGVDARLKLDAELLAVAFPKSGTTDLGVRGTRFTLEFPLVPEAIAAIQAREADPAIVLSLDLTGLHSVFRDPQTEDRFDYQVPPRQWTCVEITPTTVPLPIPRSDWYTNVLTSIGSYRYVLYALALPKVGEAGDLSNAVKLIQDAERAFALGDDPSVFVHCFGAWEAVPGGKQAAFDVVTDDNKRQRLNELGKSFSTLMHSGRHVATDGSQQGEFAVDHRDAEFALNLTKLLVGYVSRVRQ